MRVVELEAPGTARAVVGAQREVQHLVGQHEHELAVVQPRGESRVDDQPPGGEHAHRRHAGVERDPGGADQPGEVRERHGDHAQAAVEARHRLRHVAHRPVTCFRIASIAGSAPSAAPALDEIGEHA